MYFKNAIAYRITKPMNLHQQMLEDALKQHPFTPCGPQQLSRYGWTAATGDLLPDEFTLAAHGFYLIAARKEEKIIPPAVIKREVNAKVRKIEQEQQRKVYRKERNQISDEVVLDLLPRAFSRETTTHALIMPNEGFIVVDATGFKAAEELLSYLRGTLGSLPVSLPDVRYSPSAVMSQWMENNKAPQGFELLGDCKLVDNLVDNGSVTVRGQEITSEEYTAHIEAGKRTTMLTLAWEEQWHFKLHDDLRLTAIRLTDQFKERMLDESPEDQIQAFAASTVQTGLELSRLIPQIIDAFGGEYTQE